MSSLELLVESYPILKTVLKRAPDFIKQHIVYKQLNEHDTIQMMHDPCVSFPFVISGMLQIRKCNEDGQFIQLYTIESGQLCHEGLRCMVNKKLDHIQAIAMTETVICLMPLTLVEKYLLSNPLFLRYMYEDLSQKVSHLIYNKESLINESLETRLVKLLLSYDTSIIYTTHQKLADELDSSREVISKKLKDLEEKGHLNLMRGKIKLNPTIKKVIP